MLFKNANSLTCVVCFAPLPLPQFLLRILIQSTNNNQVIALNERDMDASEGLLQNKELYAYILNTSVQPREAETLKELRMATSNHRHKMMSTATDCGQLISLSLKLVNAKKTIELGVFTGYSLLGAALALAEGQIIALIRKRK